MGFFTLLILILLGYFVVWPLIKLGLRINDARRQYNDLFSGAATQQRPGQSASRKPGWSHTEPAKKKKIDPDTGEYVSFEEIHVSETRVDIDATTDDGHTDHIEIEQQVVDAEWEDIPVNRKK